MSIVNQASRPLQRKIDIYRKAKDITLIIEGEKFQAFKELLEYRSDFFKKLFTSNPEKKEFELEDVNKEFFPKFLDAIHGDVVMDMDAMYGITRIAAQFSSTFVLMICYNFMQNFYKMPSIEGKKFALRLVPTEAENKIESSFAPDPDAPPPQPPSSPVGDTPI